MRSIEQRGVLSPLLLSAGLVSACIVVAPLEDFPAAPGQAGRGGSTATGGGGSGGTSSAGDAGSSGRGGSGGKAGSAGKGGTSGRGGSSGDSGGSSEGGAGAGVGGEPGDAGKGGSGGCTTNRECVELGASEPYRCRPSDHRCVPLKTSDCPLVYPNEVDIYANPNAIYVGGFATLGNVRPDENSVVWAQRLAVEELSSDNVPGLPMGPDQRRRPLVMVVCNNDTSDDDGTIDRAMDHLANEVEVPAVVATLKPGDLVRAFEDHQRGKLFFLDPVSATSTVGNYEDDDLIWTMLGPPKDYAQGYRELLEVIETYLRTTRIPDPETKLRVALVSTRDAFNDELKNFVEPALHFNGGDVTTNTIDGDYFGAIFAPQAEQTEAEAAAALAAQIRAFRPDVVLSTAGEPFTQQFGVLEYLETRWDNGSDDPRPIVVLSPYNAGNLQNVTALIRSEMTPFGGNQAPDALAYERFVGISAAGAENLQLQNQYASRLRGHFPDAITDTGNYYDSVYFLAYALVGSGKVEPSGPDIARGMRRLLEGDRFDVGPNPVADVFAELAYEDRTLRLYGTLGPPDFDRNTGVRLGTSSVFCFAKATETSAVASFDQLRYDRESGHFDGSFTCSELFGPP